MGKYKKLVKDFIDTYYGKETVFYDSDTKTWYSRLTGKYHGFEYIESLFKEIQSYYIETKEKGIDAMGKANSSELSSN